MPNEKIFVTMKDNFMSNWGNSKGKNNIYCVQCETWAQAKIIQRAAKKRSEMSGVKIVHTMPKNTSVTLVTNVHFNELGGSWKA